MIFRPRSRAVFFCPNMIDYSAREGYNRAMLPNDPYMLFSAVNMKLRDGALSLEELCDEEDISAEEVKAKLAAIGYVYDESRRTFVAM